MDGLQHSWITSWFGFVCSDDCLPILFRICKSGSNLFRTFAWSYSVKILGCSRGLIDTWKAIL